MKLIKLNIHLLLGAVICLFATEGALADGYAEDRAEIENLMSKYIFALDLKDADAYAATFTEEGVINHAGGIARGRGEIRQFIQASAETARQALAGRDSSQPRPIPSRHLIDNLELEISGDTAKGRAYWTSVAADDNGQARVSEYGFYEDELQRVNGEWLFSKRLIVNEFREGRQFGVVTAEY